MAVGVIFRRISELPSEPWPKQTALQIYEWSTGLAGSATTAIPPLNAASASCMVEAQSGGDSIRASRFLDDPQATTPNQPLCSRIFVVALKWPAGKVAAHGIPGYQESSIAETMQQ